MPSLFATIISVSLILVSAIFSYDAGNWEIFERTGSIVTAIGFIFFAFDYFDEVNSNFRKYVSAVRKSIRSRKIEPGTTEEMRKLIDIVSPVGEKEEEIIRERLRQSNKKREFFVVVVGTIIWGWGSYLGKIPILINPVVVAEQNEHLREKALKCMGIVRKAERADDALALKLLDAGCVPK